jgi:hypothetical protein
MAFASASRAFCGDRSVKGHREAEADNERKQRHGRCADRIEIVAFMFILAKLRVRFRRKSPA